MYVVYYGDFLAKLKYMYKWRYSLNSFSIVVWGSVVSTEYGIHYGNDTGEEARMQDAPHNNRNSAHSFPIIAHISWQCPAISRLVKLQI